MLEGQGHRGGRKSSWPAGLAQCSNGAESGTMKTGGFRGGPAGAGSLPNFSFLWNYLHASKIYVYLRKNTKNRQRAGKGPANEVH